MRSSDPREGPVFLWLKPIIIIISQPGSGCDLYDEHWKVCVCVCGGGQWLRMLSFEEISSVLHHCYNVTASLFFFLFHLILHFSCTRFARQVLLKSRHESPSVPCHLIAHAWQKEVPQLWSGWGTHWFDHGHLKLRVRFCQLAPLAHSNMCNHFIYWHESSLCRERWC